ncbi:MAG: hypothetical protein IKD04_00015 [Clostridia bacterium]|nr:hypothetical protein [Clostridia bacterium]
MSDKKVSLYFGIILCTVFIFLILANPQVCKNGVISGILLCGRVIIPSLFPFTFCLLFIMRSGILEGLSPLAPVTERLFGLSPQGFGILLFSLVGGYPVGAKLLNEAVRQERLSPKRAGQLLNCCVNAGPAFIVAAVGSGILHSRKAGYILLGSHITASLVICIALRFFQNEKEEMKGAAASVTGAADSFVLSASEAAASVMNICTFVILFSATGAYLLHLSQAFPFFKTVAALAEVTVGVTGTGNIYFISFLLGFAGLSVWCQILSVATAFKIKLLPFVLFRLLHGVLSVGLTFILIKLFGLSLEALSNNRSFSLRLMYSTPALSVSIVMMCLIFLISLSKRKFAGKMLEDVI